LFLAVSLALGACSTRKSTPCTSDAECLNGQSCSEGICSENDAGGSGATGNCAVNYAPSSMSVHICYTFDTPAAAANYISGRSSNYTLVGACPAADLIGTCVSDVSTSITTSYYSDCTNDTECTGTVSSLCGSSASWTAGPAAICNASTVGPPPSVDGGVPPSVDAGNSCMTGADCPSGCCAPLASTPAAFQPVGPYVCQSAGACCGANGVSCPGSDAVSCCVTDNNGNEFCAEPCTTSATCGAASCNTYSFVHTGCSGTTACGPK
jgi:hypothetical protein